MLYHMHQDDAEAIANHAVELRDAEKVPATVLTGLFSERVSTEDCAFDGSGVEGGATGIRTG
jgi:hypothetical protein